MHKQQGVNGMTNTRKKLGTAGEKVAAAYLISEGYRVMAVNYRCKAGEIDLIVKKRDTICFVEVKSRRGLEYGHPGESVGIAKQKHIKRVADYFLMTECDTESGCADSPYAFRFDVAAVLYAKNGSSPEKIEYIEDAF